MYSIHEHKILEPPSDSPSLKKEEQDNNLAPLHEEDSLGDESSEGE